MGILTNIIAAEEDEVEAIGDSLQPVDEWSGISLRDVSIAKIATLHSLLTGDLYDDAAAQCETMFARDREASEAIDLERWEHRSLLLRLKEWGALVATLAVNPGVVKVSTGGTAPHCVNTYTLTACSQ
ncbi:MAG: hypothetical protein KGZ43_10340 [Sulfuritalea sp.]|nr:hypothetical protein [Sulfuritalea sp.]